jgi:hypothetical protein
MTAVRLRHILETLQSEEPSNVLTTHRCALCGQANFPTYIHPEPIWGSPEQRLVHFTCLKCGFYQEDVV